MFEERDRRNSVPYPQSDPTRHSLAPLQLIAFSFSCNSLHFVSLTRVCWTHLTEGKSDPYRKPTRLVEKNFFPGIQYRRQPGALRTCCYSQMGRYTGNSSSMEKVNRSHRLGGIGSRCITRRVRECRTVLQIKTILSIRNFTLEDIQM